VSADVKIDPIGLITAFGQACAYRLFSHKSYIVVLLDSPEDDIGLFDTLGRIFGIGLILFNAKEPQNASFDILFVRRRTSRTCFTSTGACG
jgi:hypothetical protein